MERYIDINTFDYPLPDERIAKFPDLVACKKCWKAWQKKYAEEA